MPGTDVAVFTRTAAAVVQLDPIPSSVIDHAKLLVADSVAVALIARHLGATGGVEDGVRLIAGGGEPGGLGCSVIGDPRRLPPGDAAFVNGATIHSLDFDDTHGIASVHPSAAVLPSTLAAAEQAGSTGDDLLRAYVLGAELVVRLGLLAPGRFHAAGIHPTGTLGTFGAALAAASIRGLGVERTADALGIALSLAPLTPLEFMTDGLTTKRIHGGAAARAGLAAAALAQAGVRGPATAIEGPRGLLATLLPPEDRPDVTHVVATLAQGWGERWHVLDIERKRYPVCHLIHPFLACLATLHARGPLHATEVDRVVCHLAPGSIPIVAEPRAQRLAPVSGYAARFSLPYVLAATLLDGTVRSSRFDDAAVGAPEVRALAARISHRPLPDADWTHDGVLELHLRSGAVVEVAAGHGSVAHAGDNGAPDVVDDGDHLAAPAGAVAKLLAEDPTGALAERFVPVQAAIDGLGSERDDVAQLLAALRSSPAATPSADPADLYR